ncbi:hypothetical protein F5Y04DRAFT_286018 [Hypomontagnella monticulosa]|nr:hypothetical protein F5Y04DRAFT_286018 [Hypomontagnella monticulosa]
MAKELPLEVLKEIVSNLDRPLAPYANVSRSFQWSIERVTFAKIETTSANDEVTLFESAFADSRRRRLLRALRFKVELPDISEKRYKKFQSKREAAENNRVYTNGLYITSASPKDWTSPQSPCRHDRPAWEGRNDYKYIEFDRVLELSLVACANMLYPEGRRINPSVLATIVGALPGLKTLDWWFYTAPRRLHPLWLGLRESMSSAVLELATITTLEDIHLYFEDSDPRNQAWEPTSIVDSAKNDGLSVALSQLSKLPRLRKLKVDGLHTLSPAIFDLNDDGVWPSLEYLDLEVSAIAPDGRWYFTGDRDLAEVDEEADYESETDASEAALDSEDSDTSDFLPQYRWAKLNGAVPDFSFRRHPDPEVFDPFVIAMASAIVRLRALKRWTCDFTQARAATIMYHAPGETRPAFVAPPSSLACGAWHIWLEKEEPDEDENWNPPREIIRPIGHVGSGWPSITTMEGMMWIIEPANLIRETMRKGAAIAGASDMDKGVAIEDSVPPTIKSMKNALMTYEGMAIEDIGNILIKQTNRVAARFDES